MTISQTVHLHEDTVSKLKGIQDNTNLPSLDAVVNMVLEMADYNKSKYGGNKE